MDRRAFLRRSGALALAGVAPAAFAWPEMRLQNRCLAPTGLSDAARALLPQVWQGLDPARVWDCHAHLVGGDGSSGAWFNPAMDSPLHPLLRLQKWFYMNAGCVDATPGRLDASYVERLLAQLDALPAGAKAMLLAFDWRYDDAGRIDREHSVFHVPNEAAAALARRHPARFEWLASIHPYRPDAVDALARAVAAGARGVKWLPSAMGIDPASPRCDAFYRALAEAGLPLLSHAGRELAVPGGSQDDGNPLKLRRAMAHGVRVIVAHCASDGDDVDLDRAPDGPRLKSFELFARLMDEPGHAGLLYADISALTQRNRVWALQRVLERGDWHDRLLNGSDYPLPGVLPLFSVRAMIAAGFLEPAHEAGLQGLRDHHPLLFDFAVKRLLRWQGRGFPAGVFETRRFFERNKA